MVQQAYNIILKAFQAAVNIFDKLMIAIPGAKTAVIWSVFVGLSLSLIIVPLRGFQVTNMQTAFADYGKHNIHNAYGKGKFSNGRTVNGNSSYKGKFEKRSSGGTRRGRVSGLSMRDVDKAMK